MFLKVKNERFTHQQIKKPKIVYHFYNFKSVYCEFLQVLIRHGSSKKVKLLKYTMTYNMTDYKRYLFALEALVFIPLKKK